MVISSTGLILTNNHVIDQATSITVTEVTSGQTYTAKVVGYNSTDDVALLQLYGASGQKTISLGNSNAAKSASRCSRSATPAPGGPPSTAQGIIRRRTEHQGQRSGRQHDREPARHARDRRADPGGRLRRPAGQRLRPGGRHGHRRQRRRQPGGDTTATQGFAIPINKAISIADEISAGKASTTVHIGLAGFIGVNVGDAASPSECGTSETGGALFTPAVNSGALVCDVIPNAPAQSAGLAGGDVITSVNGAAVTNAAGLTNQMANARPGSQLSIAYVSQSGARHTTTVTLTEWAR